MSHELRTPLNAILGFAQLLETGNPPLTDTQVVRLKQITKAGWYLLELINEILGFRGDRIRQAIAGAGTDVAEQGHKRMPAYDRTAGTAA